MDYSGVLPERRHVPIVTEPIGAEADRQALMWQYFAYLDELTRRFDPVLLAKRVILSPPSLEQRVDFLRRKGHERGGLLERVKPLVHRSQGDSRLDALVDLLAALWRRDPAERVLVAAQDNLTVDYLFEIVPARLPLIGPIGKEVQLKAALIRQGQTEEMLEDLGGYGNDTVINLDAFQRGDAQVLFAPEKAQVGLNLQRARVLVLYSVPWRPEEVEQWIGRLDRIGNAAAFSADGEAKYVDVYTIVQRGLVDEKVVTVLQRFNVFEQSVNLDGNHLEEVAQRIEEAALNPESVSWEGLESATEAMAVEDEVKELDSSLRPWLPWTVGWAKSLRQQIDEMRPVAPVLVDLSERSSAGPRSWGRAVEGMIKLLKHAGEYHIRWNDDPHGGRFRTLWYQFGERGMYGNIEVRSQVVFSFGADPAHERSPKNAYAFITRRGDIESPPRRRVTMMLNGSQVPRPLHFLSFGDPLHDELIKGWLPKAGLTRTIGVTLFDDHTFFSYGEPGLYVLRLSVLDPAAALMGRGVDEVSIETMAQAVSYSQPEMLPELLKPYIQQLYCCLEADSRWIRAQFPAELRLDGLCHSGDQWTTIEAEALRALLNPMAHKQDGVPCAFPWKPTTGDTDSASAAFKRLRAADELAASIAWSHRFPSFERSLALRRDTIIEEGLDAELLAGLELEDARRRLEHAGENGNRAQISRAESALAAKADALEVTRVLWAERVAWIDEIATAIRDLLPSERLTAVIRVRRLK